VFGYCIRGEGQGNQKPVPGPPVSTGKDGMAFDKRLQDVCAGAATLVREPLAKVTLTELAKGK
jgi:hypothetical protein